MPLCGRAIEILDAARALGDGPLVFSREDGKPLDEKRMLRVLQWHRVAAVSARLQVQLPGLGG